MNYSTLYELVVNYYPIGIDRSDDLYNDYSGTKALKELIDSNFTKRQGKASDSWASFVKAVKAAFPEISDIKDESAPIDVCFTLSLAIDVRTIDDLTHVQKLFLHLSYCGNYFCIYGRDSVYITKKGSKLLFEPIITVSPQNVYTEYFTKLRLVLNEIFKDYIFLNHAVLKKRVNGLKIFPAFLNDGQFSSIFQALFTPENLTDYKKNGDILYK